MKKILLALVFAVTGLCAFAQEKGDKALGLNLGVAPSLEKGSSVTNFGIGAKFQYNVTDPVRLEADLEYWFKDHTIDVFDISANVHYLFRAGDRVNIYPVVGIGYAHIGGGVKVPDYIEVDNSDGGGGSRFLFNLGVGVEYAVSQRVRMGLEIKYQYLKDFGRLPINVGVTYQF